MTWAPDYATVEQLRNYVSADADSDAVQFMAAWITAASRNIDDYCGRQFGQVATPEARTYTACWDAYLGKCVAPIDDLMTTVGLSLADSSGNVVTDYALRPVNNLQKGKPYTEIRLPGAGDYTITGLWGWTAVPASVTTGLLLQAARLNKRRDSPFGIAGSPQQGSELRLLSRVDPDFAVTLKPYVREWWAA